MEAPFAPSVTMTILPAFCKRCHVQCQKPRLIQRQLDDVTQIHEVSDLLRHLCAAFPEIGAQVNIDGGHHAVALRCLYRQQRCLARVLAGHTQAAVMQHPCMGNCHRLL